MYQAFPGILPLLLNLEIIPEGHGFEMIDQCDVRGFLIFHDGQQVIIAGQLNNRIQCRQCKQLMIIIGGIHTLFKGIHQPLRVIINICNPHNDWFLTTEGWVEDDFKNGFTDSAAPDYSDMQIRQCIVHVPLR